MKVIGFFNDESAQEANNQRQCYQPVLENFDEARAQRIKEKAFMTKEDLKIFITYRKCKNVTRRKEIRKGSGRKKKNLQIDIRKE